MSKVYLRAITILLIICRALVGLIYVVSLFKFIQEVLSQLRLKVTRLK